MGSWAKIPEYDKDSDQAAITLSQIQPKFGRNVSLNLGLLQPPNPGVRLIRDFPVLRRLGFLVLVEGFELALALAVINDGGGVAAAIALCRRDFARNQGCRVQVA